MVAGWQGSQTERGVEESGMEDVVLPGIDELD